MQKSGAIIRFSMIFVEWYKTKLTSYKTGMKAKHILKKSKKHSPEARETTSNSVYRKTVLRAGQMNCSVCPPWGGENCIERHSKRGPQKPRYKFYRKSKIALKHLFD
jgi:Pyruvate/2-oxoacid:ferredoxin oxidoreductase delta subunit